MILEALAVVLFIPVMALYATALDKLIGRSS